MGSRILVLLGLTSALAACASSEPESSEVRVVRDRESLAGCTRVGILPMANARAWESSVPGGVSPKLRARVTSLGGNVVFQESGSLRAYDEVWSCPVETIPLPN